MKNNSFASLIIGAGIAAVITVFVTNYFNPPSGNEPKRTRYRSYTARTPGGIVRIKTPTPLSANAAPVVQNSPITEAAYNVYPTEYSPTLGPDENSSNNAVVLPA